MTVPKTLAEEYVEDPSNMRLYQQGRAMLEITFLLEKAMERKRLRRTDLAAMLGKSRGWVTQLLNDEENHTLRTIADVFAVVGYSLHFSVGSLDVEQPHESRVDFLWPTGQSNTVIELKPTSGDVSRGAIFDLPSLPNGVEASAISVSQ